MRDKHKVIMGVINQKYNNKKILFRISALKNVPDREFVGWTTMRKVPRAGEVFKIGNNYYEFDSYNNESTWNSSDKAFDVAIIYPIDAMMRMNKFDGIRDLIYNKRIKKIFIVSWYDREDYDYSELSQFYDRHISYDM